MKRIITYGTFDLLHYGHISLLRRARALGDYLVVGITSERYDQERGKLNVRQPLAERMEGIRKSGLADKIIVEEYEGQKIRDIAENKIDVFCIGSDWTGQFDYLREYCEVVYLERTRGISSTELRQAADGTLTAGGWDERDIMVFPNGIDEAALVYALTNLRMSGLGHLLIYVCTQTPVADSERTVWLGGNEIPKRILERPASLAGFLADGPDPEFEVQVVYDNGRDLISDEDWSYDESLVEARFGGESGTA